MIQNRKRRFKWISALVVILIAPVLVYITPEIISLLLFNQGDNLALISYGKNIIMYSFSFAIVFIVILALYFIKRMIVKIFISIIGLVLFIYINYVGITNNYLSLDENVIEYNQLFDDTEKYEWAKVSKIIHELPTNLYEEKYIFEFSDGQLFEFVVTSAFSTEVKNKIFEKIMSLEASYEEY